MNILFLTAFKINDTSDRGVYPDLMRKYSNEGHNVFIVTPLERRYKQRTSYIKENNVGLLKVRSLNIQKTNIFEKWLAISLINYQFMQAVKRYLKETQFDLVIYSTPPITFIKLIVFIKRRNRAISYLLLKDIFPQNAVDLGMISKGGIIHKYFVRKEKKLYQVSDFIGCMSQANVDYILRNNPEIKAEKVEINPNSHEPVEESITEEDKLSVRQKYRIPVGKTVFIYGGNLGKPQGIEFLLDFLDHQKKKEGVFFIIVGSGTEFTKIKTWFNLKQSENAVLIPQLPKNEYNLLLKSCDVGMIFLDKRFTIPNFPSRLLSYLEYKLPVIASTDRNTDLGKVIVQNIFGLWSESGDLESIDRNVSILANSPDMRKSMGLNGYSYFLENYTVDISYKIINNHLKKN